MNMEKEYFFIKIEKTSRIFFSKSLLTFSLPLFQVSNYMLFNKFRDVLGGNLVKLFGFIMNNFISAEIADIHFIYGLANENV